MKWPDWWSVLALIVLDLAFAGLVCVFHNQWSLIALFALFISGRRTIREIAYHFLREKYRETDRSDNKLNDSSNDAGKVRKVPDDF
jgi:hypothetical protein